MGTTNRLRPGMSRYEREIRKREIIDAWRRVITWALVLGAGIVIGYFVAR